MKKHQEIVDAIKKANLPKEVETALLLSADKIVEDPRYLSLFLNYFTQLPKQGNNNPDINLSTEQQTTQNGNDNYFHPPPIKDMKTIFNEKTPQLQIDNTPKVISNDASTSDNAFNTKQKRKKKKPTIPNVLGNTGSGTGIIDYLKSLPSYPPVIFYPPNYPQGYQRSPIWSNNILAQIFNFRPLGKE
jgi:hypothetical protein